MSSSKRSVGRPSSNISDLSVLTPGSLRRVTARDAPIEPVFNVWCALKPRWIGEIVRLMDGFPDAVDHAVDFFDLSYSLLDLVTGRLQLARPLLVDAKLCRQSARAQLVRNSISSADEPFDEHSEFSLGFLLRHWFESNECGRSILAGRPELSDVFSTTTEIQLLMSQRHRIAPYRLAIGGSTRWMYADATKAILLDPDVEVISGFATSSGLAAVAHEAAFNITRVRSTDVFRESATVRSFFVGTVLSFAKTGYPAIGGEWVGALGWGGASFWLANPRLDVSIGYVSDDPTRSNAYTQSVMAAAIDLAVNGGDDEKFWSICNAIS